MTDLHRLVVASHNAGKAQEIAVLLTGLPVQALSLARFPQAAMPEETGETFEENAILKARAASLALGEWALADDSGLVVPALGGEPGRHSSRVAETDRERISWLLARMDSLADPARHAHFVCVLALTDPRGEVAGTWEGRVEGRIVREPRGDQGFGYDPVFLYEPSGQTFAEMTPEDKAAVSHRGQALRGFRESLPALLEARGADV